MGRHRIVFTGGKAARGCVRWLLGCVGAVFVCAIRWADTGCMVARADVPAVTDFGQEAVRAAWSGGSRPSLQTVPAGGQADRALFVTFYADGRHQEVVQPIRGDAVVSFTGEHPAWRLDHGLMWFVQMPVYVREIGPNPQAPV